MYCIIVHAYLVLVILSYLRYTSPYWMDALFYLFTYLLTCSLALFFVVIYNRVVYFNGLAVACCIAAIIER